MSPELSEELKRLWTERKKQVLADGKTFDMETWVFPNEDGSPIHYTNFLRRSLYCRWLRPPELVIAITLNW